MSRDLRRVLIAVLLVGAQAAATRAQELRIGVLGLFHPQRLILRASNSSAVVVHAAGKSFVLEPGVRSDEVVLTTNKDKLFLQFAGHMLRVAEISATGRDNGAVSFVLSVPGRMRRAYFGQLEVKAEDGEIAPVVTMDLETAVASAVQAESGPGTPLEALKAQAIVTRSYYVAGKGRHHNFDFCDLTHCQFLREPPGQGSAATEASRSTEGLVLVFNDKPIAVMYTRSCGGRTRTPAGTGMTPSAYPYFPVVCEYCRARPKNWTRRLSAKDGDLLMGKGEAGRLVLNRQLGWNFIPSNTFTERKENGEVVLEGAGEGHGIGLCQRGARGMAEEGAGFRNILEHYFPNTMIVNRAQSRAQ